MYQVILFLCTLLEVAGAGIILPGSAQVGNMSRLSPEGETESQCQVDLKQLFVNSSNNFAYDAMGKLPSGVLVGNWASLGHFDECQSIEGFKYCLADIYISLNETETLQLSSSSVFRWGLCTPQSCSEEELSVNLVYFFEILDIFPSENLRRVLVNCAADPATPYDAGFYCCMLLCGGLTLLMFASGIFDECSKLKVRCDQVSDRTIIITEDEAYHLREETVPLRPTESIPNRQSSFLSRMSLCFAINHNFEQLLSTVQPKKNIKCLNGIRVLSMFWVIFGHTSSFLFTSMIVDNPSCVWEAAGDFWMQLASNAFPAVDTFFFLSGLLVSYITLQKLAKTGGTIPFLSFYLHRISRLIPSYTFVILLMIYIVPYLSQGPIWFEVVNEDDCQQYWWTNILFINNFYPEAFRKQCMYWTWYLANDMQFYLISPLLLLVLYRSKYLGVSLVATLCTASIITTSVLMGVNQFSNAFKGSMDTRPGGEDYSSVVYDKPYCRITPYLIGLLLGYAMSRLKTNNQRVKLSPIAVAVGWTLSIALLITVAFGLYGSYHGDPMTVVARALYESLSRFTWSVALSWVVFACFYGYGGWVNQLLSIGLWVPLSRLVFTAYLIHPIMIKIFIFSMFEPIHYSYTMMIFYYFAFILSSFTVAMYIFLAVELPFSNLVELFTRNKYRKEDPKTNEEKSARKKQCDEQV